MSEKYPSPRKLLSAESWVYQCRSNSWYGRVSGLRSYSARKSASSIPLITQRPSNYSKSMAGAVRTGLPSGSSMPRVMAVSMATLKLTQDSGDGLTATA